MANPIYSLIVKPEIASFADLKGVVIDFLRRFNEEAYKEHADIQTIRPFTRASGEEFLLVGCDGLRLVQQRGRRDGRYDQLETVAPVGRGEEHRAADSGEVGRAGAARPA